MLKTLAHSAVVASLAFALQAYAQTFPAKPITVIVPYPPGGLTDQLSREIGASVSEALKQPVIVDNKPGGSAQIAVNVVKLASADGYTVLMGDLPSLALNPGLMSKLSYDPRKDLLPVTRLVVSPGFLVVPNSSPYKTFEELVAGAKTKQLSYASQGVGTGAHLFSTLLSNKIGAPMTHIPYKGSVAGLTDVISGQVDYMYDTVPSAGPFVIGGRMRVLAVGHDQRLPQFPNVPTLKELGYGDLVPTFWWGIAVKTGTPREVVTTLERAFKTAIHDPKVAKKFIDQGVVIATTANPGEFTAYVSSELDRWAKVIKESNMQID